MTLILTYTHANHISQLNEELLRAGLVSEEPPMSDGDAITLTMPDGTVEADVDAVVAAHVPQALYDPAAVLDARDAVLVTNRRRADYARLLAQYADAIGDSAKLLAAAIQSVKVLQARDRDAGLED